MKKIRYSRACAALPLLAIIGHAGGVSAEETASESIVVTAMRGDAEAKAVAARTTVVSRDEMELKGLVTAADVLKSVPGLSVVQSGGAGGLTSVFSRGTNSKHTLALYDGIRLNDASTPNGQFNFGSDTLGDLNAVEVLRGAASAVYGSDAIGGVINFIPRIGGDKAFMPYGEIAAGSLDTYRGMLGVRGQAGPLAYGVTGEYVETEGFNTTAARLDDNYGEKDGNEIATFTANTELTLTEGLKLRGLARYRKSRTEFDDAGLDREGRGGRDSYTVWRVAPRYTTANGAYQGDLELGQVKNERSEYNRADVNSPGGPDTGAEGLRTFAAFRNRLDIADSDRLQATLSAGIEWHRERVSNFTGDLTTLDREEEFLAFYGLAQVTLADRINLNASLRQDDPEMFSAETTWNAGAVLQLPEIGGRIYATYGTSFKSPTLSERYTVSAWNIGNADLMPEKGRSFEFGLDAGLDVSSAGWLGFQATYFDSRIDDLIEYDYAILQNLNVGRADINGYELGLHGRLGTVVSAKVNYTFTKAYNGITGEQLLRRPKHSWTANLTLTPNDRLSFTADWYQRGDRRDVMYSPSNDWGLGGGYLGNGMADAYGLLSVAARYKLSDQAEVFGSVSNALDEEYEEPNSYASAPRMAQIGVRFRL